MSREPAPVGSATQVERPSWPKRQDSSPNLPDRPMAQGSGSVAHGSGLSTESLAAVWDQAIAAATRQSPLLGQALAHATPRLEDAGTVALVFGPDSALFQDGAARQLATVETILAAALGTPIKVTLQAAVAAPAAVERKSRRLSVDDVRSERLTQLRSQDPALDAAAKALDLELVDEE